MEAGSNIKTTQILYRALLLGQAVFLSIAIYLRQTNFEVTVDDNTHRVLQVAALFIAVAGVMIGYKLSRKKIAAAREGNFSATEKMNQYRAAAIIQWALTEAGCLFSIVGYLLSGNWAFVGLAGALLFVFAGYYPSKNKIMQQLGLSEGEL